MSQFDYLKDIAKFGLENDQEKLLATLAQLVDYSKKTKRINLALQLQSIIKDGIRQQQTSGLVKVGSAKHIQREEDNEVNEFVIEKITSDYTFENLICPDNVKSDLRYFVEEHSRIKLLQKFDLPVANKVLLHGPSGCGKTLASYVLAGELGKIMYVINLGAIVSSKLGETSKNLSRIFKRAASEDSIIFLDEFDSLGKVRDYSQDHGEMKRVVNTILQLFDYLPQTSIVIAATNQKNMLDDALLRRFDSNIQLNLPNQKQIDSLIKLTLKNGTFSFDNKEKAKEVTHACTGLSYYSVQKTLITAIKRSLFQLKGNIPPASPKIKTDIWSELVTSERKALNKK